MKRQSRIVSNIYIYFYQIEVKTEVHDRTKKASDLSVHKVVNAENMPGSEESEELDQRTFSVVR